MTSREDIHRLVDAVLAVRLAEIEQLLRANLGASTTATPRRFARAGARLADVRAGLFPLMDLSSPVLDRIAELVESYADLPPVDREPGAARRHGCLRRGWKVLQNAQRAD